MSTTTIFNTNRTKPPIQIPQLGNDRSTPVVFTGVDSTVYARNINQGFMSILENFAGGNAPANPTEGMIWYNNLMQELNVFHDDGITAEWRILGSIHFSDTQPVNIGTLWYDTTVELLKFHNGTSYVSVGEGYLHLDGNLIPNNNMTGTLVITEVLYAYGESIFNGALTSDIIYSTSVASNYEFGDSGNSLSLSPAIDIISASNIQFKSVDNISFTAGVPQPLNNQTPLLLSSDHIRINQPLDVNFNTITGVQTSTDPSSLVPYSDFLPIANASGSYLSRSGGVMTGGLTLSRTWPYLSIDNNSVLKFNDPSFPAKRFELSKDNDLLRFKHNGTTQMIINAPANYSSDKGFDYRYHRVSGILASTTTSSWVPKSTVDQIFNPPFSPSARVKASFLLNTRSNTYFPNASYNVSGASITGGGLFKIYYTNPIPSNACVIVTHGLQKPGSYTNSPYNFVGDTQMGRQGSVTHSDSNSVHVRVLDTETQGRYVGDHDDAHDAHGKNRYQRRNTSFYSTYSDAWLTIVVYGD